jgi:large subunit ribosomal protein L15
MTTLNNLSNPSKPAKRCRRVGRGTSSGVGKTCGRGVKGAGARSGYKRRHTYEGSGVRLFQRLPQRGFSRGRFQKKLDGINLGDLDRVFADGETVNRDSLVQKGFIDHNSHGVKILGNGRLSRKITAFEVDAISASARAQIEAAGISLTVNEAKTPKE